MQKNHFLLLKVKKYPKVPSSGPHVYTANTEHAQAEPAAKPKRLMATDGKRAMPLHWEHSSKVGLKNALKKNEQCAAS